MPLITIAAVNVPNWERDDDVELRVYAEKSFVASSGSLIVGGVPSEDETESDNWFERAACTLAGSVLTIASLQLDSTTDAEDVQNARWCAYFYTKEGQRIGPFGAFDSFILPDAPANTTWAAIAEAQ